MTDDIDKASATTSVIAAARHSLLFLNNMFIAKHAADTTMPTIAMGAASTASDATFVATHIMISAMTEAASARTATVIAMIGMILFT